MLDDSKGIIADEEEGVGWGVVIRNETQFRFAPSPVDDVYTGLSYPTKSTVFALLIILMGCDVITTPEDDYHTRGDGRMAHQCR